jgi:hypothetical protein
MHAMTNEEVREFENKSRWATGLSILTIIREDSTTKTQKRIASS